MDREKIIEKLEKEVKRTYAIKTAMYECCEKDYEKTSEEITEHREPFVTLTIEMADKILALLKGQETIKIRSIVPEYLEQTKEYMKFVKSDMTNQIMKKLVEDGYVKFNCSGKYHRIADDEEVMNISEIEATLNVVKPFGP